MRFYYTSLLLAASSVAAVATPQTPDLAALSQCAQTAALTVIQAIGCPLLSISCFCQQPSFLQSLQDAITTAKCSASDAQAAMEFGRTQCAAAGFPLAADSSPATAASASAPAASAPAEPAPAPAPALTTTTVDGAMTVTSTLMSTGATSVQSSSLSAPVAPAMPTIVPAGNSSNSTWMTNNTIVQPAPFVGAAVSVKMGGVAAGLLGLAIAFATL